MIEDLVELIKREFAGVTRHGGVSWTEADAIDAGGASDIFELAKTTDTESNWIDLISDPNWKIFEWSSNWSFLDDIGFRYYLPAAMCRELTCEEPMTNSYQFIVYKAAWACKFANFSAGQMRAIAHFIEWRLRQEPEDEDWHDLFKFWSQHY